MAKLVCVLQVLLFLSFNLYGQVFTNIGPIVNIWHQDLSPDFGSGVSLVDVNQDGWDDITLLRGGVGPQLFLNNQNGFYEVSLNINLPYDLKQACWVDVDNDGHRDLAITCYGGPFKIYRNLGNLTMMDVSASTNIYDESYLTYAQSWADYDRDGDLDLYISNYNANGFGDPSIENFLYSNNGDFTFTDVTAAAGIGNGSTETLAATWFDHNNDMWPDLMIANDRGYTPNALYVNNTDGTFTEISEATNTHIFIDAMGLAIDDFSGDGQDDIYVTNNWGNRLHKSNGGVYMESNTLFDDNVDFLSWGASWLDYDLDGLKDLYVAVDYYLAEQNYNRLFQQQTDGTFNTITVGNAVLDDQGHHYGTSVGDFNNDGFPDLSVVSSPPYFTKFWQNNLTQGHWLKCRLQGTVSNRDAVGSTILCYSPHHTTRHVIRVGESYLSQNSLVELVGLGSDAVVDSLVVKWPSGIIDKWFNIPADQTLELIEGQGFELVYSADFPIRLCNNAEVEMQIENEGLLNLTWSTENGEEENSNAISIEEPGAYIASFNDSLGNLFLSDTIFAYYATMPNALWQIQSPLCADDDVLFQMLDSDDYQWNLDGQFESDSTAIELENANSQLMLFDVNGCVFEYDIEIQWPEPLSVSAQITGTSCYGQCDGHVNIIPDGGAGGYQWSVPDPNALFWCAGNHEVELTDSNGCALLIAFDIPQPQPIVILPALTQPNCYGESNGQIELEIIGGTGNYQLSADFITGQSIPAGSYHATVEDALGCVVEQTIDLTQPDSLVANYVVVDDEEGQGLGGISITPQGGTPPFEYWWSNGAGNTPVLNGLSAGQYMVQVVDAHGCTDQKIIVVENASGIFITRNERMAFYPNPAHDFITWIGPSTPVSLCVFDMQGRIVWQQSSSDDAMDCRNWPRGCYTIVYDTPKDHGHCRIVVE